MKIADKLIVLNQGIVGTHKTLIEDNSYYQTLISRL